MLHKLFPHNHFFVIFKAPNAEELIEYVSQKEEIFETQDWQFDCKLKTINCDWDEFLPLLAPSVQEFANHLGKPFEYKMYDPWINYYAKGFFQETHDHRYVDFASVFFPNAGENFGKFYFKNRDSTSLSPNWCIYDFPDVFYPDIEAGDIMFFPANELHGVSVHNSDVIRKTLSCNYKINSPL